MEFDPEVGCQLLATDLEIGVRIRAIGVQGDEAARLVLPPEKVKQILTLSRDRNPELELVVSDSGDSIRVTGRGCRYDLPLEDSAIFPDVPDFGSTEDYVEVAASDLLKAIKRTIVATDLSSTRYALGGVLFEFAPDSVKCVATDGRRLHLQSFPSEPAGKGLKDGAAVVIPVKALKVLERLLSHDDPPVAVALQANTAALFRTEGATLYTRLVEGRFPKYDDVFAGTESATGKAVFEAGPVLCAFREASITTSEESRGIECAFGPDGLVLDGSAADKGASKIEREISYSGTPASLSLDARYVIDAVQSVDPKAVLTARLTNDRTPLLLTSEDDAKWVVMPLSRS